MAKKIKLNLGSGPAGIKGWINYDNGILPVLSKFPKLRRFFCLLGFLPKSYDVVWPEIVLHDIRKKFPLSDNLVDYIYCSQVLEHFNYYEAQKILLESFRVLKIGGIIRISVPDIAKILSIYSKLSKTNPKTAAREMNVIWWGYEKDISPKGVVSKLSKIFIREHQWHYDRESIRQLLIDAGFNKIRFYQFHKGSIVDLTSLEIEKHKSHSLYLEAVK